MTNPINAAQAVRQSLLDKIALHESRIDAEQAEIVKLRDQLVNYDAMVKDLFSGTVPAAPITQVRRRSGTETAGKRGPKPRTGAMLTPNTRAEGRRAVREGLRPALKDAMVQVMGDQVMNASQVYEALQQKGWLPSSNDPRQYITYKFSRETDTFERAARGSYRVKESARVQTTAPETPNEVTETPSDAEETSSTDEYSEAFGETLTEVEDDLTVQPSA